MPLQKEKTHQDKIYDNTGNLPADPADSFSYEIEGPGEYKFTAKCGGNKLSIKVDVVMIKTFEIKGAHGVNNEFSFEVETIPSSYVESLEIKELVEEGEEGHGWSWNSTDFTGYFTSWGVYINMQAKVKGLDDGGNIKNEDNGQDLYCRAVNRDEVDIVDGTLSYLTFVYRPSWHVRERIYRFDIQKMKADQENKNSISIPVGAKVITLRMDHDLVIKQNEEGMWFAEGNQGAVKVSINLSVPEDSGTDNIGRISLGGFGGHETVNNAVTVLNPALKTGEGGGGNTKIDKNEEILDTTPTINILKNSEFEKVWDETNDYADSWNTPIF